MGLTSYVLSRVRGVADESSLERAGGHLIDWAAITADADGEKRVTGLTVMGRKADGKLVPRAKTIAISALSIAGSVATATSTAHGLAVGERVTIAGATPSWANGERVVATVADANTFTYAVSQPAAAAEVRAVTLAEATDLVGLTAHGLSAGDIVEFEAIATATGLSAGTNYYVIASGLTANACKVSATAGGSAIDIATGDGTALMRVVSGGTYAATGTITAARSAVGILETNAAQNASSHALSGYSLLVGGVFYENLLPDATGTPKVLPAAYKAELVSAGCAVKFAPAYADNRAD
jgi:hypothetical protein